MCADASVGDGLLRWSREEPDKPAFIFRGTQPGNNRLVLTRADVYELAASFSALVRDCGVKAGEVVCNTLPNSPERLVTDLGLMMAGATTMNGIMQLADGQDLVKTLTRGVCVAMVMDPTRRDNALHVLGDRVIVRGENAQSRQVPSLKKVFKVDCGSGSELRPWLEQLKQREAWFHNSVSPHDCAIIFNSAGTEGFSKLVPRTHQQFITMGEIMCNIMEMSPTDILFNDRSLGWYNGACCDYVAKGSLRVLVDMTIPPKDPLAFAWESCLAEHCTVCFMLPPAISLSLTRPVLWANKKHKPGTIFTGGMPLSKQQVSAVGILCDNLVLSQSSAETGYMTKLKVDVWDKEHFEDGDYGHLVPGYCVRLVSAKGVEIAPSQVGRVGEVQVKGPQVFNGYVSATHHAFGDRSGQHCVDGWMLTGDVAFYNTRRNLQAVCRSSNAIMHGPYVIYPRWLEKKLEECPGVKKVVIVPVPDARMFQEMCACILPQRGEVLKEADIKAFCHTVFVQDPLECQHIPKYYVFFQDFPTMDGHTLPDKKKIFYTVLDRLKLSISAL